jgi:hypothetical protein
MHRFSDCPWQTRRAVEAVSTRESHHYSSTVTCPARSIDRSRPDLTARLAREIADALSALDKIFLMLRHRALLAPDF